MKIVHRFFFYRSRNKLKDLEPLLHITITIFLRIKKSKMDITLDDKLNVLQQINQRKLVEILDTISGTKHLIIEPKLIKILDSFVGVTVLK